MEFGVDAVTKCISFKTPYNQQVRKHCYKGETRQRHYNMGEKLVVESARSNLKCRPWHGRAPRIYGLIEPSMGRWVVNVATLNNARMEGELFLEFPLVKQPRNNMVVDLLRY